MSITSESTLDAYEETFITCAAFNIYEPARKLLRQSFEVHDNSARSEKIQYLNTKVDQLLPLLNRSVIVQDYADTVGHNKAFLLFKQCCPFTLIKTDLEWRDVLVHELAYDYLSAHTIKQWTFPFLSEYTGKEPRLDDADTPPTKKQRLVPNLWDDAGTLVLSPLPQPSLRSTLRNFVVTSAQEAAEETATKLFKRFKQLGDKQQEEEEEEADDSGTAKCNICGRPNDRPPPYQRCTACYKRYRPTYRPRGFAFDFANDSYRHETDAEWKRGQEHARFATSDDPPSTQGTPSPLLYASLMGPQDLSDTPPSRLVVASQGSTPEFDNLRQQEEWERTHIRRQSSPSADQRRADEASTPAVLEGEAERHPEDAGGDVQRAAVEAHLQAYLREAEAGRALRDAAVAQPEPFLQEKEVQTELATDANKENEPPCCALCGRATIHRSYLCPSHEIAHA